MTLWLAAILELKAVQDQPRRPHATTCITISGKRRARRGSGSGSLTSNLCNNATADPSILSSSLKCYTNPLGLTLRWNGTPSSGGPGCLHQPLRNGTLPSSCYFGTMGPKHQHHPYRPGRSHKQQASGAPRKMRAKTSGQSEGNIEGTLSEYDR